MTRNFTTKLICVLIVSSLMTACNTVPTESNSIVESSILSSSPDLPSGSSVNKTTTSTKGSTSIVNPTTESIQLTELGRRELINPLYSLQLPFTSPVDNGNGYPDTGTVFNNPLQQNEEIATSELYHKFAILSHMLYTSSFELKRNIVSNLPNLGDNKYEYISSYDENGSQLSLYADYDVNVITIIFQTSDITCQCKYTADKMITPVYSISTNTPDNLCDFVEHLNNPYDMEILLFGKCITEEFQEYKSESLLTDYNSINFDKEPNLKALKTVIADPSVILDDSDIILTLTNIQENNTRSRSAICYTTIAGTGVQVLIGKSDDWAPIMITISGVNDNINITTENVEKLRKQNAKVGCSNMSLRFTIQDGIPTLSNMSYEMAFANVAEFFYEASNIESTLISRSGIDLGTLNNFDLNQAMESDSVFAARNMTLNQAVNELNKAHWE